MLNKISMCIEADYKFDTTLHTTQSTVQCDGYAPAEKEAIGCKSTEEIDLTSEYVLGRNNTY